MRYQFCRYTQALTGDVFRYYTDSGVTVDGSNYVQTVADQSGNNNTATPANVGVGLSPTLEVDQWNGRNSFLWEASLSRRLKRDPFTQGAVASPYTIYSVHWWTEMNPEFDGGPSVTGLVYQIGGSAGTYVRLFLRTMCDIVVPYTPTASEFLVTSNTGGSGGWVSSSVLVAPALVALVVNGASSALYVSDMTTAVWSGTLGGASVSAVHIGAADGDENTRMRGYTYDLAMVPGAADSTARAARKTTLESLWGPL